MISLVAIGFFSLNPKGWHGGSVLLLFQSLAIPFVLIVLSCHERRPPLAISRITDFPVFALSTVSAVLFALFLPVSIGFYGVLLVVWSLVPTQEWYLAFVILSIPIIALAGIKSMFFQVGDNIRHEEKREFYDLTYEEVLAILPIGAILLFLGLMPKVIMGPIGVSATALLQGMGIKN
jgi:NADH-quinone oxidoreductase subunit M